MTTPIDFVLHRPRCLLFLLALVILAGCSGSDIGPTGTVTGIVTFKGQPLSAGHGVVFLEPQSGHLAYGTTDAAGKFHVDSLNDGNLPAGRYAVTIRPAAPAVDPESIDPAVLMDHPEMAKDSEFVIDFPKKYLDNSTSGLVYDVKEGANDFQIELEE